MFFASNLYRSSFHMPQRLCMHIFCTLFLHSEKHRFLYFGARYGLRLAVFGIFCVFSQFFLHVQSFIKLVCITYIFMSRAYSCFSSRGAATRMRPFMSRALRLPGIHLAQPGRIVGHGRLYAAQKAGGRPRPAPYASGTPFFASGVQWGDISLTMYVVVFVSHVLIMQMFVVFLLVAGISPLPGKNS
jgi:hypothetical protein